MEPGIMIALLLAKAAAPLMSKATPGRPAGNPGEWVTTDDYPAAALRSGAIGTTVFAVTYGVDGLVKTCEIAESSGSNILDEAACEAITQRAKFVPGTDEAGRPMGGVFRSRVRWAIPQWAMLPLPTAPQVRSIEIDVDAQGKVERCAIPGDNADTPDLKRACVDYQVGRQVAVYGTDGKAVPYRVTMKNEVVVRPR